MSMIKTAFCVIFSVITVMAGFAGLGVIGAGFFLFPMWALTHIAFPWNILVIPVVLGACASVFGWLEGRK
jgi:hypothetical protein